MIQKAFSTFYRFFSMKGRQGILPFAQFPKFSRGKIPKDGDILVKEGIYKNRKERNYPQRIKAEYITLSVKENRNDPESRIIFIPVLRICSISNVQKEPVFILNGGPGSSNFSNHSIWLIDQHDIVIVGYRGVDGSTRLQLKKFSQAMAVDLNMLSIDHLKKLGTILRNEFDHFTKAGIDLCSYNLVEVVDDLENTRIKLGYEKINLYACSYGVRLSYVYGLRYPESINRSILIGINPPGRFVFNPCITDDVLKRYAELWKNDILNSKRSPDIILTMKKVLASMPVKWKEIIIDPAKVRMMMFYYLYSINGAAQVFDAFIAAENGDYSGLACLVMMCDLMSEMDDTVWGDSIMKAATADCDIDINYITGMDSKENLLGAVPSKLFAAIKFSDYKMNLIPEKYRKLETSNVDALLINGNLDIATPLLNARELIEYLPNGKLIEVSDCSHLDIISKQRDVFIALVKKYFLTGQVEDGEFKHIPANLKAPETSLQKRGKAFYILKRLGLLKIAAKIMR